MNILHQEWITLPLPVYSDRDNVRMKQGWIYTGLENNITFIQIRLIILSTFSPVDMMLNVVWQLDRYDQQIRSKRTGMSSWPLLYNLILLTSSSFSVFVYVHEKITCSGNPRIHPPSHHPHHQITFYWLLWSHDFIFIQSWL